MKLTARQVYDKLVNDTKIIGEKGLITFELKGFKIKIGTKDTVGNLIQEWFGEWLKREKIDHALPIHTQDFPDFHLDTNNRTVGLLEVKSFDYDNSPNFDVAAFMAYRRSLLAHPYRLDSDYLIFGYSMNGYDIKIENVWLKKVWEITSPSGDWPLKCQVKQGEIFNIRPTKWYKKGQNDRGPQFQIFNSALDFATAFDGTQRQWERTRRDRDTSTWLTRVKTGYKDATGNPLV